MPKQDFKKDLGTTISGQVVHVFAAVSPEDLQEGRGPKIDRSYHQTEHDARVATKGISVMGSDGDVEPRLALRMSEDEYILLPASSFSIDTDPAAAAALREEALKKLSPAERAALLGDRR